MCFEGACGDVDAGAICTPQVIWATDYDQSCTSNSDCVPVYQGSLCSECRCPNETINSAELAKYEAASNTPGQPPASCFCPAFPPPLCQQGVCTAQ
jgi:hypothetical protein